jgi:hypothetical protein
VASGEVVSLPPRQVAESGMPLFKPNLKGPGRSRYGHGVTISTSCPVLALCSKEGLDKGEPLLFVTTTDHRIVLHRRLLNESVLAPFKGVYLAMDATDTLSRIMVDDWPDQDLFMKGCLGWYER